MSCDHELANGLFMPCLQRIDFLHNDFTNSDLSFSKSWGVFIKWDFKYRSFSRDVITFWNLKLNIHQRYYPRQALEAAFYNSGLQFYCSLARFVWKSLHFEFPSYGGAWHKAAIEFVGIFLTIIHRSGGKYPPLLPTLRWIKYIPHKLNN